jgi:group I intron endonuclease
MQANNLSAFLTVMPAYIAYYQHLNDPRVVRALCYRFKGKSIIYGIRCKVTNMVYIGSTLVGHDRFYQHLISGKSSNTALQEAINMYGLSKFTAYVFEKVSYPVGLSYAERTDFLRKLEQMYIAKFSKFQLYNAKNAVLS